MMVLPATAYVLPQYACKAANAQVPTSVLSQRLLDFAFVNRYDLKATSNHVNNQTTYLALHCST